MNNLKNILLLLLFAIGLQAQSASTMFYHMPIYYKDSGARENSSLTGVYLNWEVDLSNTFEFAADYSSLNYNFLPPFDHLDQYDFTFVYKNESLPEWNFSLGGHYIISDDALTDKSYVLFGGIGKYRFRSWDAMIDIYYSNYGDYFPSFNAIQFSPHFGLTFMFDRTQGLYLNSKAIYIMLSEPISFNKDNFFSVQETLTYFNSNLSVSVYALFGEQMFAVRQNGFLVYNVADLMKNGFGGSIAYSFSPKFFLKAGVEYDKFDEEAYGTSASSTKFLISAGFTF